MAKKANVTFVKNDHYADLDKDEYNKKAHGLNAQPLKDLILGSSSNVNRQLLTHILTNVPTYEPTYGSA